MCDSTATRDFEEVAAVRFLWMIERVASANDTRLAYLEASYSIASAANF